MSEVLDRAWDKINVLTRGARVGSADYYVGFARGILSLGEDEARDLQSDLAGDPVLDDRAMRLGLLEALSARLRDAPLVEIVGWLTIADSHQEAALPRWAGW